MYDRGGIEVELYFAPQDRLKPLPVTPDGRDTRVLALLKVSAWPSGGQLTDMA